MIDPKASNQFPDILQKFLGPLRLAPVHTSNSFCIDGITSTLHNSLNIDTTRKTRKGNNLSPQLSSLLELRGTSFWVHKPCCSHEPLKAIPQDPHWHRSFRCIKKRTLQTLFKTTKHWGLNCCQPSLPPHPLPAHVCSNGLYVSLFPAGSVSSYKTLTYCTKRGSGGGGQGGRNFF